MMRSVYLFDLDGTLMDTSGIASVRKARQWKECVRRIGETILYSGVADVLATIRQQGDKIGVVTTSVSFYAEAALRHHKLPYDTLVAYHDVRITKPAPDCYLLALERLAGTPQSAAGIGDDAVDATSLRAAGLWSIAAGWNPQHHSTALWDEVAQQPRDVLTSQRVANL